MSTSTTRRSTSPVAEGLRPVSIPFSKTPNLPETGCLRLAQIIGQREITEEEAAANRAAWEKAGDGEKKKLVARRRRPREAIPAIIPVSHDTWWKGVKSGRYPQPVRIGKRAVAWRVEDIRDLIAKGVS